MLSIKAASLTLLCIWMTLLTVVMHVSRTERPPGIPPYKPASAVILAELGKLLCSLLLAYRECKKALSQEKERSISSLYGHINTNKKISGGRAGDSQERAALLYDANHDHDDDEDKPADNSEPKQTANANTYQREVTSEKHQKPLLLPAARIISPLSSSSTIPMSSKNKKISARRNDISQGRQGAGGYHQPTSLSDDNDNDADADDEGAAEENDKLILNNNDKNEHSSTFTTSSSSRPTTPSRGGSNTNSNYPAQAVKDEEDDAITAGEVFRRMKEDTFGPDWLKLSIPAFLFTGQSNLSYYASSNLSVPVFQITYQLKIPATALCSVLMLNRALSRMQWFSIVLLSMGVGIVQLASSSADKAYHPHTSSGAVSSGGDDNLSDLLTGSSVLNNSSSGDPLLGDRSLHSTTSTRLLRRAVEEVEMNQMLGLIAVVLACLSSGFSGVFFEKQLKRPSIPVSSPSLDPSSSASPSTAAAGGSSSSPHTTTTMHYPAAVPPRKTGLWVRNIQLSMFSLIVGSTIYALMSPSDIPDFLIGFTPLVWFVIFVQVVGGLLAAIVIQYADNIAKSFSASCSIILSFAVSIAFFDFRLSTGVVVGSAAVIFATWLFNFSQPKSSVANVNNNNNTSFLPTSQNSSPISSKPTYHHIPTSPSPSPLRNANTNSNGPNSFQQQQQQHHHEPRRPSVFPWVGAN